MGRRSSDPDSWRLRLYHRVPGGKMVARFAPDADRRRDERDNGEYCSQGIEAVGPNVLHPPWLRLWRNDLFLHAHEEISYITSISRGLNREFSSSLPFRGFSTHLSAPASRASCL